MPSGETGPAAMGRGGSCRARTMEPTQQGQARAIDGGNGDAAVQRGSSTAACHDDPNNVRAAGCE
jgi:hypothetical protein